MTTKIVAATKMITMILLTIMLAMMIFFKYGHIIKNDWLHDQISSKVFTTP